MFMMYMMMQYIMIYSLVIVDLIIQFNFRQAVLTFFSLTVSTMDYPQVYDSQFENLTGSLIMGFLENKKPSQLERKSQNNTFDTDGLERIPSKIMPEYTFSIKQYQIGQYVQYSVVLKEHFKVLKRTVVKQYSFRTRYSMLEALDENLGGMGLPKKKWFGNLKPQFIEKRKIELQQYLNRIAKSNKIAFYKLVKQIKDIDFNLGMNQIINIE